MYLPVVEQMFVIRLLEGEGLSTLFTIVWSLACTNELEDQVMKLMYTVTLSTNLCEALRAFSNIPLS